MKTNESEWVSFSDFMASIIAVLIIFIIVLGSEAAVDPALSTPQGKIAQKQVTDLLKSFSTYSNRGVDPRQLFEVDTLNNSVSFIKGSFDLGCPCLRKDAEDTINAHAEQIRELLLSNKEIIVTIEGHADTTRVPVAEKRTWSCGLRRYSYADNVTLSLLRAEEARTILTRDWHDRDLLDRVAVTGFGATKPKENAVNDEENRRVVLRFTIVK